MCPILSRHGECVNGSRFFRACVCVYADILSARFTPLHIRVCSSDLSNDGGTGAGTAFVRRNYFRNHIESPSCPERMARMRRNKFPDSMMASEKREPVYFHSNVLSDTHIAALARANRQRELCLLKNLFRARGYVYTLYVYTPL